MKKTVLALAAFLTLNASAGFAAPINDLYQNETAVGLSTDAVYLEHRFTDKFTLGLQSVDRDYGDDMDDIYGQFHFNDNLRGIIGHRSFYSESDMYLGIAVNGHLSSEWDGYGSLIASSDYKELQVGGNMRLDRNLDLNVHYYSFMPDHGDSEGGLGVGVTYKF